MGNRWAGREEGCLLRSRAASCCFLASKRPPASSHPQARRAVSAMTDTERKLNAKLLREVEAAAAAGIPAVRSPTRSPAARA